MSLRILGGRFRNRTLFSPKGVETRPTSGLVRKALFDILQADIENSRFLDLFAGSGAMGLEALSRGASHATFVDSSRFACDCIKKNLHHLGLESEGKVMYGDVVRLLDRLANEEPFTFIYIDPPYDKGYIPQVLEKIDTLPLLASGGRLFAEESSSGAKSLHSLAFRTLTMLEPRRYGNSTLIEFRR